MKSKVDSFRMIALIVLFLLSFFLSFSLVFAEKTSLKVRVSDYPPQYYKDTNGNWTGLDVELGRALIESAGYTPEFNNRPWARALNEMKNGDLDVMMNLSVTPDRSEYMHWIGPERNSYMTLIVKKGNEHLDIKSLADFPKIVNKYGIKFGIQNGIFYSDEFSERLKDKDFAHLFEVASKHQSNPLKVRKGRILGFFEDKVAMVYKIAHDPDFEGLAIHPFILQEEKVYFGISKKISPDILEKLKKAYERLEQDGTFNKIREKAW